MPEGRRGLHREEIVRAAVEVADEGGRHALTMQAVAARLGPVTPMALYRHVVSKDGLTDLMLDAAVAEVDLPGAPGPDWRTDLAGLAARTWQMIVRHPWWAELLHTRPPAGPHLMRRTEFVLAVLTGQGLTVGQAMTYTALLDRHLIGAGLQAAEEHRTRMRYGLEGAGDFVAAIQAMTDLADGARCPLLRDWLAAPTGPSDDDSVALGVECLLDGIAARLPGPQATS
nr:TetR/AcrR family transcriptional regulator [Actinopolymorpha cephalotaxi]